MHERRIIYPSFEEVDRLYGRIIEVSGGEHAYLSRSNLEYLLETVRQVGEKVDRKQALVKKAGYLLYNIITQHPFVNGNKRTAYEVVEVFLQLNGYELKSTPSEAFRVLLDVASGKLTIRAVEKWIATNLTELDEE